MSEKTLALEHRIRNQRSRLRWFEHWTPKRTFYAQWQNWMKFGMSKSQEVVALTRQLEEARVRIGELERELKREKKLHQQANTMRIQQMDRDSTVITSLKAALTRLKAEKEQGDG